MSPKIAYIFVLGAVTLATVAAIVIEANWSSSIAIAATAGIAGAAIGALATLAHVVREDVIEVSGMPTQYPYDQQRTVDPSAWDPPNERQTKVQ